MKFLILFLVLLVSPHCAWADAGLNYVIYAGTGATPTRCTTCTAQLASGTLPTLNYDFGGGSILNSGRKDRVIMHITGYVLWPGAGAQSVSFYDRSDDGFHLTVNNTVVINNWQEQGPSYYNGSGTITLQGGQYYPVEIWWYENGGGAVMQLNWNIGSGIVIVPTSAWSTVSPVKPTTEQSVRILTRKQEQSLQSSGVYVSQLGSNNMVHIEQMAGNNLVRGTTDQNAVINGDSNTVTILQNGATAQRVDLHITGNSNQVQVLQGTTSAGQALASDSGGHYARTSTTGNNNLHTVLQNNQGQTNSGHYAETTVTGSNNTVRLSQTQDGTKTAFQTLNGDSNIVALQQTGNGSHYLDSQAQGGLNNITVTQSGNMPHAARVQAVNNGGAVTIELNQTSSTSQNIQIQQTCIVLAGCAVRINQ